MAESVDRRQARLAQALRANLKRRKAGEGEKPSAATPVAGPRPQEQGD